MSARSSCVGAIIAALALTCGVIALRVGRSPVFVETFVGQPHVRPARSHVVHAGETLSSIARDELGGARFCFQLADWNGIQSPYAIQVGDVLMLEEPKR